MKKRSPSFTGLREASMILFRLIMLPLGSESH